MNQFQIFHTYQKLARNEKVPPLKCTCGQNRIVIDNMGELGLWCPMDGSILTPGSKMVETVTTFVNIFKENDDALDSEQD